MIQLRTRLGICHELEECLEGNWTGGCRIRDFLQTYLNIIYFSEAFNFQTCPRQCVWGRCVMDPWMTSVMFSLSSLDVICSTDGELAGSAFASKCLVNINKIWYGMLSIVAFWDSSCMHAIMWMKKFDEYCTFDNFFRWFVCEFRDVFRSVSISHEDCIWVFYDVYVNSVEFFDFENISIWLLIIVFWIIHFILVKISNRMNTV